MDTVYQSILYPCSADHSLQPARFHRADDSQGPRPLAVALHTWSYTYTANADMYLKPALEFNWHLIFPDFRGPNWTPEACGSDLAVQDIADAVTFVKSQVLVDNAKVYLIGGSGGGHASLLLAARHPELWSAVSSWCPIFDLQAWHKECSGTKQQGYADHIEKACGGNPQSNANAAKEALHRSSKPWIAGAKEMPIDIATGIHDGHTGSVPVSHALHAFNALAAEADRISEEDIDCICRAETIPTALKFQGVDPGWGRFTVLFRRISGNVRITLFEGGHNLLGEAGMMWLSRQSRGRKADWSPLPSVGYGDCELSK